MYSWTNSREGTRQAYSLRDLEAAQKVCKQAVNKAWANWQPDAPDKPWADYLPDVLEVACGDTFEIMYAGQYVEAPDDEKLTFMKARIRHRRLNYRQGPHKLDRILFYFEDAPNVTIHEEKV
jgi:hypothetical protein